MDDINEIVRIVTGYFPDYQARIGTVCAADTVKKTMKLILEPEGVETGWCKTLKGAFTDETGVQAVALSVGKVCGQYIVLGLINEL